VNTDQALCAAVRARILRVSGMDILDPQNAIVACTWHDYTPPHGEHLGLLAPYAVAGFAIEAGDDPFETLEELCNVLGIPETLIDEIVAEATVIMKVGKRDASMD
jgi:hypothetical protein